MYLISQIIGGLVTYGIAKVIENELLPVTCKNNIFKIMGTDDALYYIDNDLRTVIEIEKYYNYYDLRPDDIVLDIGACIGGFALKVRNKVSHVYAVEPLMTEQLERNIALNNANNITVINCALGDGLTQVYWKNNKEFRYGLSLQEIIDICGGHIDFLKSDCEGGETCIKPTEIAQIRRIEAEIHSAHCNYNDFLNLLNLAGFEFDKRYTIRGTMMISAKNKYI